ncbi:MAG: GGDEF domain-containing protein [Pseudohongiella sp.]|nr:GGDEF domain-containing protein [Pseudohongiella sp.]
MRDICPANLDSCAHLDELALLRNRVAELNTQVITDELTGLFNYRHLLHTLSVEIERVRRSGGEFSVLIVDFDNFKKLNDTYGHDFGNLVLRTAGTFYRKSLRKLDVPCRFGGEEFVMVLPGTGLREAVLLAERLRKGVEALQLFSEDDRVLVTVSTGVDVFRARDQITPDQLIHRTDKQLLQAKQMGKNRVCFPDYADQSGGMSYDERAALMDGFSNQRS